MAVSSLPRAQIVTDLARMHRPNEPKSGGAPASAAAIGNQLEQEVFEARTTVARARDEVARADCTVPRRCS